MKKKGIKAGITLLIAVVLSGCGEEALPVYDFAPIIFNIQIKDAEGTDMLDPEKEESFLNDLTVSYAGEAYSIEKPGKGETREYIPMFYGLRLDKYWSTKSFSTTGNWCLKFGEFDGSSDVTDLTIDLSPGNDKHINLSYTNMVTWVNGRPNIFRRFFVDGKELTDDAGCMGCFHFLYTSAGELEYLPSEYE